MTATTYTHIPGVKPVVSFGGWLVRLFERLVEAQEIRVRKRVQTILRNYDDETLKNIGYTESEIENLRKGRLAGAPAA